MILFFVGVVEMIIATSWTKLVVGSRVIASGIATMISVLIWYYVLRVIVDDIDNLKPAFLYAFGCAVGTVLGTYYFDKSGEFIVGLAGVRMMIRGKNGIKKKARARKKKKKS